MSAGLRGDRAAAVRRRARAGHRPRRRPGGRPPDALGPGRGDLHGAVQAVELGRGLTLHAATSTAGVPALLERAGHDELAGAWRNDPRARQHDPAPTDSSAEPDYVAAAA